MGSGEGRRTENSVEGGGWVGRGNQRVSGHRIQTNTRHEILSHHVDEITVVAQKQYTSLLMGLQAIGQTLQGWKVQQPVFVGGTCGSKREDRGRLTKSSFKSFLYLFVKLVSI